MRILQWMLAAVGLFAIAGCECSKKPDQSGNGQSSSGQSTNNQSSETAGGEFRITMPEDGVQGPNVRAAWTTEGHPAGTTYSYVVGKGDACSEPVYQGNDMQVSQIALSLQKGTYYLCVTQKSGETTRSAANSPYKFKVNL
jgi:hypothetical protein